MAVILRYFNEFGKRAFQLITASSSIELIDQESYFYNTHRAMKLVCEQLNSRIRGCTLHTTGKSVDVTYV